MLLSHHLDLNGDSDEMVYDSTLDWGKTSPIVIDDDTDEIKRSRTPILIDDDDLYFEPLSIREDHNKAERSDIYIRDSPNDWWESENESQSR